MKKAQAISDFIKKNRRLFIYLIIIFIIIFFVFLTYIFNSLKGRVNRINEEFSSLMINYIENSIDKTKRIAKLSEKNLGYYVRNDNSIKYWCRFNNENKLFCNDKKINQDFYNNYINGRIEKTENLERFLFSTSNNNTYLGIIYSQKNYNDFALYSVNNFLDKVPRISRYNLNILEENKIIFSNKFFDSYDFVLNKNKRPLRLAKKVLIANNNIGDSPYELYIIYSLDNRINQLIILSLIFLLILITLFIILYNVRYNAKHILADIDFLNNVSNDLKNLLKEKEIKREEIEDIPEILKPIQKKFNPANVYSKEMKSVTVSYHNLMNEIYYLVHKISLQNEEISAMNENISKSYNKLKSFEKKLNSFLDQMAVMAPEKDLEEFSQEVLELLLDLIPAADAGSIGMIEGNKYKYLAQVNYSQLLKEVDFPKELIFITEEPQIYKNLHNKYHIDMPDEYVKIFKKVGSDNIKSSLAVGIKTDQVIGNIFIDSFKDTDAFTKEDKKVINGIARILSIYFYLKITMDEIDKSYLEMIKALVNAVEIKDKYTRGHSERVAAYSVKLAEILGFSYERLKLLREAALLHDIGKIGIAESVLNKRGKLNDDEYEAIKMHSIFGWSLLSNVEGLQDLANIVRYHHERWDGKGYPDRLSGDEVPLESRIISIFDAFDTILTARSYKKAYELPYALKEIADNAGTQFDPHLCEVFLNNVDKDWIEE